MNDFGTWLKTTRKSKGINQRKLSRMTNISQGTICNYEHGKYEPSLYTMNQITHALGYELVIRERI
jgi:transcriptional regulator with XRE-family HTH domain